MPAIFRRRHLAELNSNQQKKGKNMTDEKIWTPSVSAVIAMFEAGFHPHADVAELCLYRRVCLQIVDSAGLLSIWATVTNLIKRLCVVSRASRCDTSIYGDESTLWPWHSKRLTSRKTLEIPRNWSETKTLWSLLAASILANRLFFF